METYILLKVTPINFERIKKLIINDEKKREVSRENMRELTGVRKQVGPRVKPIEYQIVDKLIN